MFQSNKFLEMKEALYGDSRGATGSGNGGKGDK